MLTFLLLSMIALAVLCFYLGWIQETAHYATRGKAQAGFILSVAFIVVLLIFINIRSGSNNRLLAHGITPHPDILQPMGLAAGQNEPDPLWVLETSRPGEEMLDFYRDPDHISGWEKLIDQHGTLEFRNDSQRLHISGHSKKSLIIWITPLPEEAPGND